MRSAFVVFATLVSTLTGCIDWSRFELKEGVYIVNGGEWQGSVLSVVPAPLIVEVRDSSGRRMPFVEVEITTSPQTDTGVTVPAWHRRLYVCAVAHKTCAQFSDGNTAVIHRVDRVSTDSVGRIYLTAQLGTITGPASVVFNVPSLGVRSSMQYLVEPGPITQIIPSVRDTTIYVGEGYTFIAHAADRFGNLRGDSVTLASESTGVFLLMGQSVYGVTPGRGKIFMWTEDKVDTAFVTVTPAVAVP